MIYGKGDSIKNWIIKTNTIIEKYQDIKFSLFMELMSWYVYWNETFHMSSLDSWGQIKFLYQIMKEKKIQKYFFRPDI